MKEDPIAQYHAWLAQARRHNGIIEPTAACLATASKNGQPSARMVLVKEADERGFTFYTNLGSRKAQELRDNPKAALCIHWMPLLKQVRVEGAVQPVTAAEADKYFAQRLRESRIGAWASKQSEPLESREILEEAVAEVAAKYEGKDVPRPDFWSGWRLVPKVIEFWEQGEHRLHDRILYTRQGQGWEVSRLYP